MRTHPTPAPARSRRAVLALTTILLATGAAACGDDGDPQRADTQSVDQSSAAETEADRDGDSDSDSDSDSDENGETGSVTGDPASAEVLGSSTSEMSAGPTDSRQVTVRVDVTRLERNGDLVELTLRLTNETEPPTDGSQPREFDLSDAWGVAAGTAQGYDMSEIGLVDGDAQQMYMPVRDSNGTCLCSKDFGNQSIVPGASRTVEATFGGVPEDVSELDIRLPLFPTITGVPVQ